MTTELDLLRQAKTNLCQIAGFAVVAGSVVAAKSKGEKNLAVRMRSAFVGPYGASTSSGKTDGLEWAGLLPGKREILSTWAHYSDDTGECVLEGEFYQEAWGHRPLIGEDPRLAQLVLERVLANGYGELRELNGLFSGFVYSRRDRRLWLFSDPGSARLLYYRVQDGRCEAATNIYAFSACPTPPKIDRLSLNEHLAFGAPLSYRTLLEGVKYVPPGKVVEVDRSGVREHRYFQFPARLKKTTKQEVAESICSAVERQVRYLSLGDTPCCMGLSGGKDSRIVLASVLHEKANVLVLIAHMSKQDPDALIALELLKKVQAPHKEFDFSAIGDEPELIGLSSDASLLGDGYAPGFGFQTLSALAANHSPVLFTGFMGDCLSGSWAGLTPWRMDSPAKMAALDLALLGFLIDPNFLRQALPKDLWVPRGELVRGLKDCYTASCEEMGDMLAGYLALRIGFRSGIWGTNMPAPRLFTTKVKPFCDRGVIEAYLRLPISYINGQKAHGLAGRYRYPAFGDIPSRLTRKVPLKYEYIAKRSYDAMRRVRQRLNPRPPASIAEGAAGHSVRSDRFRDVVLNCQFYNNDFLKKALGPTMSAGITKAMHKMAATAIHVEGAINRRLLLDTYCLPVPAPWRKL